MLDFGMHRRWVSIANFSCILLFSLSSAFAAQHSNVILITLDTTRADRMGFLGSTRKLTPNLDAFAGHGVVFTRAYSQVPLTTSSHATILSGTYPQFHNVFQPPLPLPAGLPYAPEILRQAGYHTAAFVGSMMLQPDGGGAPGFDRGFEEYDAGFHNPEPGEDRYTSLERRGDEVVSHALEWIAKHKDAPFFVWIHLFDPHAPYEAPEPFGSRFKASPYDGEIAYTDSVMGKLFDQLRASKLYEGSVIALMADHGEALGEHGERGHGVFLYDPTIRVPLIFKMPGQAAAGKRIDTRVELVDVLPTLLEAVGVSVPKEVQGRSLMPLFNRGGKTTEGEDRQAYSETDYPRGSFGWSPLRSLRTGKYLFVQAPKQELYDEASDPGEDHNVASTSPAVAQALGARLGAFREKTKSTSTVVAPDVSPERAAKLGALGYVAATNHGDSDKVQGADPKDRIEIFNQMTEANFLMEQGKYADVLPRLQAILAKDPTVVSAYQMLAHAYMRLGDQESAISALRKEVELAPTLFWGHYELGMTLEKMRDLKAAQPELELAAAGLPKSAEVQYELARLYLNTSQLERAAQTAEEALKLQPGYFDAALLLGYSYVRQNNPAAAIPYLQEASKTRPNASRPHEYMAQAYKEMGNEALAKQEQAMAEQLKQGAGR
jgi:choline-sulfatase